MRLKCFYVFACVKCVILIEVFEVLEGNLSHFLRDWLRKSLYAVRTKSDPLMHINTRSAP